MKKLLVVLMFGTFLWAAPANGGGGGCQWRHFFYDGNPTKHETTELATHTVPAGHTWKVTNVSLLVEKFQSDPPAPGEFTAVIDGYAGSQRFIVGQSTTPTGDGIGLQAQGATNVGLEAGTQMRFFVWVRPGTNPGNYYYTLGATVKDCAH